MPETNIPRPLNKTIRKMQEGLGFTAIKSGNNWMLPLGQDAAEGQYVVLNGVIGKASAAIVGGVDAVVSGTNWDPEDDGGALNALNSNFIKRTTKTITTSANGNSTLNMAISDYNILSIVAPDDTNVVATPYCGSINRWHVHCAKDTTGNASNQTINLIIIYTEI